MVAAGAVAGYMLAPRAPSPPPVEETTTAQVTSPPSDQKRRSSSGGGGGLVISLPVGHGLPGLGGGGGGAKSGEARPDCYFLRISYNNALKAGPKSKQVARARGQAKQAGCYVPEPKS
jgi:hypothetical protein